MGLALKLKEIFFHIRDGQHLASRVLSIIRGSNYDTKLPRKEKCKNTLWEEFYDHVSYLLTKKLGLQNNVNQLCINSVCRMVKVNSDSWITPSPPTSRAIFRKPCSLKLANAK